MRKHKPTYISTLRAFGFKKMPWDKCPQGFEEANYPCYSHKEKNFWAEVYLGDERPYGWIIGSGMGERGMFFDDVKTLLAILKTNKFSRTPKT